jgi:hypothetical protein
MFRHERARHGVDEVGSVIAAYFGLRFDSDSAFKTFKYQKPSSTFAEVEFFGKRIASRA